MITKRDAAWYNLAVKVASDSLCYDKHGCVIVRGGSVISLATNRSVTSHPVSNKYLKQAIHAEQRAILKASECKGATLYSARLHLNPISRPCDMCDVLIEEAGISTVVFNSGQGLVKVRGTKIEYNYPPVGDIGD